MTNGSVCPHGQACELYCMNSVSSLTWFGTKTKSTPCLMSHCTCPCATRIGKQGSATVRSTPSSRICLSLSGDNTGRKPSAAKNVAQNGSLSYVYMLRAMPTVRAASAVVATAAS